MENDFSGEPEKRRELEKEVANAEYLRKLEESIQQTREGKVVTFTLDEWEAMLKSGDDDP